MQESVPYVAREIIVKFKKGATASQVSLAKSRSGARTKKRLGLDGAEVVGLPQGMSVDRALAEFRRNGAVEYAEPNYLRRLAATPNDQRFNEQWGLLNTGQTVQSRNGTSGVDVKASLAWDKTQGAGSVIVAVLDSGVDINHPDLAPNVWVNPGESGALSANGVDDDQNGVPDDVYGWDFVHADNSVYDPYDFGFDSGEEHGTHVAGIIAAAANNGGIVGTAPGVKIMPLKVCSSGLCDDARAIEAINYAKVKGARIINASWGGGPFSQALKDAIQSSGMVFVAAAGNGGIDGIGDNNDTTPFYPASYNLPNVISVAAVDNQGNLTGFSNYSTTSVDVAAPGQDILSTLPAPPSGTAGIGVPGDNSLKQRWVMFWGFGLENITGGTISGQVYDAVYAQAYAVERTLAWFGQGLSPADPILVVDDDESNRGEDWWWPLPDQRATYTNALANAGYTNVSVVDVTYDQSLPTTVDLSVYKAVVWFTGSAFGNIFLTSPIFPLTSDDQTTLTNYVYGGGNLFLSGPDATFGITGTTFYSDTLKASYSGEWCRVLRENRGHDSIGGITVPYAGFTFQFDGDCYDFLGVSANGSAVEMRSYSQPPYDDTHAYGYMDGTSMAAPFVSGVAALVLSHRPQATATQVVQAIEGSVTTLQSLQGKVKTNGLVNAEAALTKIVAVLSNGGGGGGGGGGGAAPPDENLEEASVGAGGDKVEAFKGEVVLDVPAGTFDGKVDLSIRRLEDKDARTPAGFTAASPVYEFKAGGSPLKKPVTVRIKYDEKKLAGANLLKLGAYRQDDTDPTKWTYVGGRVDRGSRSVEVSLRGFSRYALLAPDVTFADLQGHWARSDIEVLAARGIIAGVNAREFRPESAITRAELAKLLVEVLTRDPSRNIQKAAPLTPTFSDVAPGAWQYVYVETATKYGLVRGEGGRFRPDDPVTRQELAAMIMRALGLDESARAQAGAALAFDDAGQVAGWARGYVILAREKGLIKGLTENTFGPGMRSTRAQAAALVLRTLERMGLLEATLTVEGTVEVNEIEGRHYELVATSDQKGNYVLIPVGAEAERALAAGVGKRVRVTGFLHEGPSIYMRGPILRVTEVSPVQ